MRAVLFQILIDAKQEVKDKINKKMNTTMYEVPISVPGNAHTLSVLYRPAIEPNGLLVATR